MLFWWKITESNRCSRIANPRLMPHKSPKLVRNCKNCNKEFIPPTREVNRGFGHYCSRTCGKTAPRRVVRVVIPNCICSTCGAQIYKSPSKRKNSRSGLYFCSRSCKDKGQRLESNLPQIHPSHYGKGEHNYREIASRHYDRKCVKCGYCKIPEVLETHHKDRNTSNNHPENLEVLCPTCHMEDHFLNKDGRWRGRKTGSESGNRTRVV